MGRSANNTGRSKRDAKHVRLYEHVLRSDAYRHLDAYARTLLVELGRLYNGSNNGEIHMSYREAAIACNCSEKPIRRAFRQLQETGFIQVSKLGGFCKIRNLSKDKFQKLVRIDERQQLSEGRIRALVIQAQLQAGAT